jgi:hypothetical protein
MSKQPNPPNGGYWYGAATSLMDGAGVEYMAGIAAYDSLPKTDPARFRFSVFRIQASGMAYLPLEDEAAGLTGAGEIYTRSDGQGRYRCTSNKIAYDGPIPGFVPMPKSDTAALEAQVAQLQQTVAALPPTTTGPTIHVPAQGGLEGGEIQFADGVGGVWAIDCRSGNLRFIHNGVVYKRWPE